MKTKSELQEELVNLEKRLREVKKSRKAALQGFKDQIGDVEDSIEQVLQDLTETEV